jgi:hypothetical protein
MKNLLMVVLILLVVSSGAGDARAVHEQALKGETVVNGEVLCDENPATPNPPCTITLPVDPFNIDAVMP